MKRFLLLIMCSLMMMENSVALAQRARPAGGPAASTSSPAEDNDLSGASRHVYKRVGDVGLGLYVFSPPDHGPADRRPAIVFFFGGGWLGGTPSQFAGQCRFLASRGMVAATADYRVYMKHHAMIADCTADAESAIRWLRTHARELGIDPDRIAAGGGSAGGHLAAATATLKDFTGEKDTSISFRPNALVLFNPAIDLTVEDSDSSRHLNLKARLGAPAADLSPMDHIHAGLPPTIIFHGRADPLIPFAKIEEFVQAMTAAGNRCELVGYDGQKHAFFNQQNASGKYYRETMREMAKFLSSLGYLRDTAGSVGGGTPASRPAADKAAR